MKYKKYLLFLLLIIVLGCNKTYAAENVDCYYLSNEFAAQYDSENNTVYVDKIDYDILQTQKTVLNLKKSAPVKFCSAFGIINAFTCYNYTAIYTFPKYEGNKCPEYLVVNTDGGFFHGGKISDGYYIYATHTAEEALDAREVVGKYDDKKIFYAPLNPNMTEEQYYDDYLRFMDGKLDTGGKQVCNLDDTFDTCKKKVCDSTMSSEKCREEVEKALNVCTTLFGDKKDEDSIAYLIDSILQYVRIIVPIIVILLGTIDIAKAMVAGKPDEMEKAQKTFIKRVIIGVAVFFVPALVDLIMWLADIVWQGLGYSHCSL